MKTTITQWKVGKLIDAREQGALTINAEYQRGAVWKKPQVLMLVDSVLRGYSMPLIFLRLVDNKIDDEIFRSYEVIDGQQRINALRSFKKGTFIHESMDSDKGGPPLSPLFDPAKDSDKKWFPIALDPDCEWAGLTYERLSEELKEKFLNSTVSVIITECVDREARDLFIRLQGGRPLSSQEIRDVWPGDFCGHVLDIGGKDELHKPGHDFFRKLMRVPNSVKKRELVAQLLMLFLARQEKKGGDSFFTSIKSAALDNCYLMRDNMRDKTHTRNVERFKSILDKLTDLFYKPKRPPMKSHHAMHLILFADMLWDDYVPCWMDAIARAHDKFSGEVVKAKSHRELTGTESEDFRQIWHYYQGTKTGSNNADTMRRRHEIYVRQMLRLLGDKVKRKAPQRGYTADQREAVYYRDQKKCRECGCGVSWNDAEIHHKIPHSEGGGTTLENGVLVCRKCHKNIHGKNR